MPWSLSFTSRARRQFERLATRDAAAIEVALDRLLIDPGMADFKKLGGSEHEWRLRVGRWRVIIELDNHKGEMTVSAIEPRDRAYR